MSITILESLRFVIVEKIFIANGIFFTNLLPHCAISTTANKKTRRSIIV